jgi:alpha-mannosidase
VSDEFDGVRTGIDRVLKAIVRPARFGECVPFTVFAHHVHGEPISVGDARGRAFEPFEIGGKWGGAWDTTWFRLQAAIPDRWAGEEVVARIEFGGFGVGFTAEALIWGDDGPVQGLHPKHREHVVARPAAGGEAVDLLVEAAANPVPPFGTSPWPLLLADFDGPPLYHLARAELAVAQRDVEALFVDMFVLRKLLDELPYGSARQIEVTAALEAACAAVVPDDVRASAVAARAVLEPALARGAGDDALRVSAIGNAHIDSAWLWPIRETKRKCARTFANAVRLMDEYPEYRFSASQAQQYAWTKAGYPELYERMRARIAEGRFEPVGSMWVEADCNVPSGESLVRQIVHGKRFFLDEFGIETTDLWLPDVFGYAAALPQILQEAGITSFLTQKISWNEVNKFPHHTFWWEGIDGTRVLTHFPPADTYGGDMSAAELAKGDRQFAQRGVSKRAIYPYGYGDGGGGPNRAMLEAARRFADLDGVPVVELDTVASFWDQLRAEAPELPVWVGELYLEYHRGTYTTNGPIKRGNRRNEEALRAAELWSVAAAVETGDWAVYPAERLDEAWKLLLLNQFHDIIPGSSIHWANQDCLRDHERIAATTAEIIRDAQQTIAARLDPGSASRPVVVFNAASRERAELVEIEAGRLVRVEVPACGYTVVDLDTADPAGHVQVADGVLENEYLRVAWDTDGLLTSVFDKQHGFEVLAPGARGNLFQLHDDNPADYDAWNVDVEYLASYEDLTAVESIAIVESGPQRGAVRFERSFGASRIVQTLRLATGSRRLEFVTEVDWHERHKFLKVAFPVNVHTNRATYEIQFGHLERATHANTSWDAARFEVCAQRWADLGEPGYGVALLNDCKYGYDIRGNVMRLSLLRAPAWPDPQSDQGTHRFSYALFPHPGDLRAAGVIAEAEAFNLPLVAVPGVSGGAAGGTSVVRVDRPNVTVEAVKRADRDDAVIVRLTEAFGAHGRVRLTTAFPLASVLQVDLLERDREPLAFGERSIDLDLRPFELVTLKLVPRR